LAAARELADRGDLSGALRIVESAPLGDPALPAANALATLLSERMALAHREVAAGLSLRSAKHDDEALRAFRRAELLWPRMPGLGDRMASVAHRVPWLREVIPAGRTASASESEASTGPVSNAAPIPGTGDQGRGTASVPAVGSEEIDPERGSATRQSTHLLGVVAAESPSLTDSAASEEVAQRLAAIEARLSQGEIESSMIELMVLYRSHATDQRVRQRLSRLLAQRALMRFGGGAVGPAVEDWQRVLEIEPCNREAQQLLAQARAELARNPRR
jgi:hypothetical protein